MSPAVTKTLAPVKLATIEEEYDRCPQIKREDIQAFKDWYSKQPHLPELQNDIMFALFLRACRFSIEKAKTCMDNFFTFRTHVPEMSINRHSQNPDIINAFNTIEMVVLDKTDPRGNLVCIQRLRNTDPSKYDITHGLRAVSMMLEAFLMERGTVNGGVLIMDQKGYGLSHIARVSIFQAKKLFYYLQECVGLDVTRIHIINANSVIEKILTFFKAFMNKQLADSIVVHTEGAGFEDLYKEIPREILPSDYGGPRPSMEQLHDEAVARLSLFNDYFEITDKLQVNESKRPGKAKNTEAIFGVEGSFKKLAID